MITAFFSGCTRLRKITLPDTLTSVGVGAFAGCASLKEIRIPDGVTFIGAGAFSACESLENIELPAGVTAIEAYTFNLCRSFTRFTVPASIVRIDEEAFDGCYSLKEICNLSTLNITAGGKDFGGIARYAAAVYSKDGQTKLSTDKNGYVVYTDGAEKTLVGYLGADPRLVLPKGLRRSAIMYSTIITQIRSRAKGSEALLFRTASGKSAKARSTVATA